MGLLDQFLPEDPDRAAAARTGLLNFGAALLANRTPYFGQALGQGAGAGLEGYQNAMLVNRQNEMDKLRLESAKLQQQQLRDQMADQDKVRGFYADPSKFMQNPNSIALAAGAANGVVGPRVENAPLMEQAQKAGPQFDAGAMYRAMLASGSPTLAQAGLAGLAKDDTPMVLGEGAKLVNRQGKVIANNPNGKPIDGYLLPDGNGGYRIDPTLFGAVKDLKATGAPKTTVTVPVKVGETFGKTVAEGAAKHLFGQVESAFTAPQTLQSVAQIENALSTNNVIAGPAAKWRIAAEQVFGKDPQKLESTRSVIQGLAQLSLNSRQSLKGQGPITEGEQAMLTKAVSGDIGDLTVGEINLIVQGAKRQAMNSYQQGKKASAALGAMPEFQHILPAFSIPDLPNLQPQPQPNAIPLPPKATASSLVKGQVYATKNGPLMWNGLDFVRKE